MTKIDHDSVGLEFTCRVWPPNAKLYLVAHRLSLSTPILSSFNEMPSMINPDHQNEFLFVPQQLESKRYGIIPNYLGFTLPLTNGVRNESMDVMSPTSLINYESIADAVRARPAAGAFDEMGLRLTINKLSELKELKSIRLHCLASNSLGSLLSRPFRILPASKVLCRNMFVLYII